MKQELKGRYRNKLNKIVAEVFNGEKWIYIKTLSDPLKDFPAECQAKVSYSEPIIKENEPQKFVKCLLNEVSEKDINDKNLLDEQRKILTEIDEYILGGSKKDLPSE